MTTQEEAYERAMAGIAGNRAMIMDVCKTIKQGLDAGDDPVIWLHNLAAEYGKQPAFHRGGTGPGMFAVACFLLVESGYFDEKEPAAIEAAGVRVPCPYDCDSCHDDECPCPRSGCAGDREEGA